MLALTLEKPTLSAAALVALPKQACRFSSSGYGSEPNSQPHRPSTWLWSLRGSVWLHSLLEELRGRGATRLCPHGRVAWLTTECLLSAGPFFLRCCQTLPSLSRAIEVISLCCCCTLGSASGVFYWVLWKSCAALN